MLIFAGSRNADKEVAEVYYWEAGEKPVPLPLMLDKVNHSPTGFEWGYYGSGPAQLAFSMLFTTLAMDTSLEEAEVLRVTRDNYQKFKEDVICCLPFDSWTLSAYTILSWVAGEVSGNIYISREWLDSEQD